MSDLQPSPMSSAEPVSPAVESSSSNPDAGKDVSPSRANDSPKSSGESGRAPHLETGSDTSAEGSVWGASAPKPDQFHGSAEETNTGTSPVKPRKRKYRISLREYMGMVTIGILTTGLVFSMTRLRRLESEVLRMRTENGYLQETDPGQIAAARAPSDQPLTYRVRVRVPEGAGKFRVAYSSIWPSQATGPQWYGAVRVPAGESLVTIRILEDPRDKKWKIASLVSSMEGNQRMATVLPPPHVKVFRGSYDVLSTGVGRETYAVEQTTSIRLLDERWLVGEGGLLLYGDRAPRTDQIGIYAELQPDVGPL